MLAFLTALEPDVMASRQSGRVAAAVLDRADEAMPVRLGDLHLSVRGSLALLQRMLLDAGVQVPAPELSLPDETTVEDGRIVPGRILNGDERLRILPTHEVGAARIRLLRTDERLS